LVQVHDIIQRCYKFVEEGAKGEFLKWPHRVVNLLRDRSGAEIELIMHGGRIFFPFFFSLPPFSSLSRVWFFFASENLVSTWLGGHDQGRFRYSKTITRKEKILIWSSLISFTSKKKMASRSQAAEALLDCT
jgi:hypothetical protein